MNSLAALMAKMFAGTNFCGYKLHVFKFNRKECENSHYMVQGIMTIKVKEGALIRAQCTHPPT